LLLLLLRFRRVFSLERFFFFDLFFVGAKKKEKVFRIKNFQREREGKSLRSKNTRAPAQSCSKETSRKQTESYNSYLGWFHRVSSVFIRLLYLKD